MRRFALVVGIVVALGLGAVPSAVAANPGVNHFTTESFTDSDFCGTGQPVDTSISVKGTEFCIPTSRSTPATSPRSTSSTRTLRTAPPSAGTPPGRSPTRSSRATRRVCTRSRPPSGGCPGCSAPPDGVVLLGAGYLVLHEVFNGDEFVSREIVVDKDLTPTSRATWSCSARSRRTPWG